MESCRLGTNSSISQGRTLLVLLPLETGFDILKKKF